MAPPKRKTLRIPKRSSDPSSSNNNNTHPRQYQGPQRKYYLSTNYIPPLSTITVTHVLDLFCMWAPFVFCLSLRLEQLKDFNHVLPNETIFIKAIYRYSKGLYYNDSLPPLSRLIIYFIAKFVGGFDASSVGSESEFLARGGVGVVPLFTLRLFNVLLSCGVFPVFYTILRKCGVNVIIGHITCMLLCFENLFALESRIISIENLNVLFLALVALQLVGLQNEREFSKKWYKYLVSLGLILGLSWANSWNTIYTVVWLLAVFAVKFISNSQDLSISNGFILKQYTLKLQALVILPLIVYALTFVLHIKLTDNHHLDSSFLSTAYQRSQRGHPTVTAAKDNQLPQFVPYGSTVTLVHEDSLGGYLHSHPYNYKTGSLGQQVTVFGYLDYGNGWIIEPRDPKLVDKFEPRIKTASVVKLRHRHTGKLLSVDAKKKPPISEQEYDFEVSCVGNSTDEGSDSELFQIAFINDDPTNTAVEQDQDDAWLQTGKTKFALYNPKAQCYVLSHDLKLPEWGFGQQEVICIKEPNPQRKGFFIEDVQYQPKHLQDSKLQKYFPIEENYPIWRKFVELNKLIRRYSLKLQEVGKLNSTGLKWIFNQVQYVVSKHSPDSIIYATGNSFNLQMVLLAVVLSTLLVLKNLINPTTNLFDEFILNKIQTFLLGFFFHLMFRSESSLLVEYKSSLLFGFILIALVVQNFINRWSKSEQLQKQQMLVYGTFGIVVACSCLRYYKIVNLTLGLKWVKEECLAVAQAGYVDQESICDFYTK